MNKKFILVVFSAFIALFLIYISANYFIIYVREKRVSSFEDCIKAGFPLTESYPANCRTPDGRIFVQELSKEEQDKLNPPPLDGNNNENQASCTDSLGCPDKMKCENLKCVDVGCLEEGQSGPSAGINPNYYSHLPDKCCEGLTPIKPTSLCENKKIVGSPSFICTKCGNGICGPGESKCNCPDDCPENPQLVP